jgi:DNA-directed RNA polymerase specialized sigma24 family protein
MDQLYILYFARLAKFFRHMAVSANLVEELTNDTMFEVWKRGASVDESASVLLVIMRLAYSRVQSHFNEARADEPHFRGDAPSDWQVFLQRLSVEKKAVLHLVYAGRFSRGETADIMRITCDDVEVLLSDVRMSANLYFSVTSASGRH